MSAAANPDIVTDGLVLCLDAADKKSLLAPPTTNLANNSNGTINWTTTPLGGTSRTQSTVDADSYHYRFVLGSTMNMRFNFDHTNLTDGETYIVSYKYKITSGSGDFRVNDFCDISVNSNRVTTDIGDGWYYETAYGTRSSYTETYDFFDFYASAAMTVDIKEMQVEHTSASSPLATPFVSYQRKWQDRQGGNDGTFVNMNDHSSYSSNNGGYLIFDGTDSEISLPEITLTTQWTISYWFYHDHASSYDMTIGKSGEDANRFYHRDTGSNYKLRVHNDDAVHVQDLTIGDKRQEWVHLAFSMNSSTGKVIGWLNGEKSLDTSSSNSATFVIDNIGSPFYNNSYFWQGYIGPVHVHNKQLTDAEALQNFNATKSRFGL